MTIEVISKLAAHCRTFFRRFAFGCVGTALVATGASATVVGGPIVSPLNGHIYYLLSKNTWTASQAEANTLGGNLVTIRSVAEGSWVQSTFGSASRELWIGLTDQASEGTFLWISGDNSTYRNWATGEPNNQGNEDYVHAYTNGLWNDLANSSIQNGFPLQGIAEVVPEPTTWMLLALGTAVLASRFGRAKTIAEGGWLQKTAR